MNKNKIKSIVFLITFLFASAFLQTHANEDDNSELPEITEETIEIFDGMEIYPNHIGSNQTENGDMRIGIEPYLGENMGGIYEEITPELFNMPSGGPYVGYFNGTSKQTINIYDKATGGSVITYVSMNGGSGVFGVLDHSGSRYKIALSGVIGWVDDRYLRIHKFTPDTIQHNFYRINGGDLEHLIPPSPTAANGSYSVLKQGEAPSYLKSNNANAQFISFDGHYFYDATVNGYNKLISDYNNGHRNQSKNKNEPYYNYFQWLPARSQSSLNADDMRKYLTSRGYNSPSESRLFETEKLFIDNGTFYGGNSALGFATAVHESGWGTSEFSTQRNNYFGHNAYDSSPGMASAYATPNFGIGVHFGRFWNWNYLNTHPEAYNNGASVGNKSIGMNVKYASDPYWGEKIASHYYNMDKLAPASRRDYKRYTIGLYTDKGVNVRKDASTSQSPVYANKLEGMPIAIIEQKQGQNVGGNTLWYGFSADPMLDGNKNILQIGSLSNPSSTPYNIAKSTVYVHSAYIKIVSQGKNSTMMTQKNITLESTPSISKTPVTITTTMSTALKPDPSSSRTTILNIPSGKKLSAYKTNNGYYQVIYGNHVGYVKESDIGGVTPTPKVKLGDLNNDGKITVSDMAMLQAHLKGTYNLSADQRIAADINEDGKISVSDMAMLQAHLKGTYKIKGW